MVALGGRLFLMSEVPLYRQPGFLEGERLNEALGLKKRTEEDERVVVSHAGLYILHSAGTFFCEVSRYPCTCVDPTVGLCLGSVGGTLTNP